MRHLIFAGKTLAVFLLMGVIAYSGWYFKVDLDIYTPIAIIIGGGLGIWYLFQIIEEYG